jgi:hypothetical protein
MSVEFLCAELIGALHLALNDPEDDLALEGAIVALSRLRNSHAHDGKCRLLDASFAQLNAALAGRSHSSRQQVLEAVHRDVLAHAWDTWSSGLRDAMPFPTHSAVRCSIDHGVDIV